MTSYLEVLPAYWGIETFDSVSLANSAFCRIWKYYPPTGVLKRTHSRSAPCRRRIAFIWKYYPPTGVLKPCYRGGFFRVDGGIQDAKFGSTTRLLGY